MRKLKFRQPILDKNGVFLSWHYWGFMYDGRFDGIATDRDNNIEQAEERSQQFTGLLDKTKKEIYDGDIVKFPASELGFEGKWATAYIEYDGGCSYSLIEIKPRDNAETDYSLADCGQFDFKIIGNTYETPELLTEET